MSSQPPMGGHLAIPQNGILYTNEPPMGSHLHLKATFPVSQGWLLIAGSTVYIKSEKKVIKKNMHEVLTRTEWILAGTGAAGPTFNRH